ncbi:hypothetical protein GCM10010353_16180 [Streptomyces chryseus]|nr:hypothetical protein GCM10010353_16180 [Streptomyces chryseus]
MPPLCLPTRYAAVFERPARSVMGEEGVCRGRVVEVARRWPTGRVARRREGTCRPRGAPDATGAYGRWLRTSPPLTARSHHATSVTPMWTPREAFVHNAKGTHGSGA